MAGARMGSALRQVHRLLAEGTMAGFSDGQLLDRFLTKGDEAAFAALVGRHGPKVLGACRVVLGDPDDVEDAFQATFLVLVCRARSIRGQEALGSWLRQVAHRVAVRAGTDAARRRACERRAGAVRAGELRQAESDDDWRPILHEELARLSDKYRLPLLLCDMEGKTHAEAAAELGCGPATVQRRLTGARALLRSRLTRARDCADDWGACRDPRPPGCRVRPPGLDRGGRRGARPFASRAARLAIDEVVATAAEALAHKCLRRHGFGTVEGDRRPGRRPGRAGRDHLGRGSRGTGRTGSRPPEPAPPRPQPVMSAGPAALAEPPSPSAGPKTITFHGRVVDPQGHPFAGATIHLAGEEIEPSAYRTVRATSGPDGRFRFEVPGKEFTARPGGRPWGEVNLVARAPGYACGLADDGDAASDSTLTLASDDAPITGRLVDLEGRPVAGASVKVMEVRLPSAGTFDADVAFARAVQVLNAVRPVHGPYARSVQAAVAQQLNTGFKKDVEDRKEWDTLAFTVPAQPGRLRADGRVHPRCHDRSRRPVPDRGNRPRADRHA